MPGNALVSQLTPDSRFVFGPGSETTGTLNVLQGEPTIVRELGVNQWAMQSFKAESVLADNGLMLNSTLSLEGGKITGSLRNDIGRNLEDIILLSGTRFARLGDLAAGEERSIDASFEANNGAPFPWALFNDFSRNGPSRDQQRRQSILEAYFQTNFGQPLTPNGMLLLGWTDLEPLTVEVADTQVTRVQTTLVTLNVPPTIIDGRLSLPPGSLVGRVIETANEAGECGPGGRLWINNGSAVLEYRLPTQAQTLAITELTLFASRDGMPGPQAMPTVELYEWSTESWVELDELQSGDEVTIESAERFFNPVNNTIRLQATDGVNNTGGCSIFDFAIEGEVGGGEAGS